MQVLRSLDLHKISVNNVRNEVRFAYSETSNPTSNILNLTTLQYYSFSSNAKGNIYTLVMHYKNLNFPRALEYVANLTGLEKSALNTKVKLPFGGFYKKLLRQQNNPELSIPTYDTSLLQEYSGRYNTQFLKDGISFETQDKFNIGIDFSTMRITIPIWTFEGKLAGILGRAIEPGVAHEERWLPIIPCSRSYTVFGYHQNYQTIQEKSLCIIFESEKAVCQADSFGCNIALATGGCHISSVQARYIKSLMTNKIIVAFDEGLDEADVIRQAEKLKSNNPLIQNKVGYVWDSNHTYIPKDSKLNAADMGKEIFTKLIKEKVRWLS